MGNCVLTVILLRQISPYGQWVHLAVVYDGATITLYVDKMPVKTVALTGKYSRRMDVTHCHMDVFQRRQW